MNLLFIGDIVGKPGRQATKKALEQLKKERAIDFVIANGENMAHGKGISLKTFHELENEIDLFTTGNHTWADDDVLQEVEKKNARILRPINFAPGNEGVGVQVIEKKGQKIGIINLIGRVFMRHHYDCPFRAMDEILKQYSIQDMPILVDFHAEATSEKIAMKHYLEGRVTALVGTHTHVPTADAEITAKKTAYITDVGMCGPADSVIGVKKEAVIKSFLKQIPFKIDIPASGPCLFNAVMITIIKNSEGYQSQSINPIRLSFT